MRISDWSSDVCSSDLRGVFVGGDGQDGGAIAPGLQFDARLPGYERVGLIGHAYYAPGVVSFGDVDSYRDLGAVLSYQINRSDSVFGGYRNGKVTNITEEPRVGKECYSPVKLRW